MIKRLFPSRPNEIKKIGDGLFERRIFDVTVRSRHYNTLKNTFDNIFIKGIYDFNTNNRSPFIIDGGANIGMASLYWKHKFPSAEIVAFEPSREVYSMMLENLRINRIDDVRVFPSALHHTKTELVFGTNEGLSGSLIPEKNLPTSYTVRTEVLSQFVDRPVDLLKLDIEGSEFDVLVEIEDRLHLVERIFIEYHSFETRPQQLSELLGLLQRAHFRYHLTSEYALDSPFLGFKRSLGQDLQVNIWATKGN